VQSPHAKQFLVRFAHQARRVHGDELFSFETIDEEARRFRVVEFSELFFDSIQTLNSAAVVALVVTKDQPL
jgi:hypothetical protein